MPSDSCIQAKPFIVTIIGGAGAGKSQLAKATVAELGDVSAARVPTDYFLRSREVDEPLCEYLARPLEYDWDLLQARLQLPAGTQTSTPDYDFVSFRRRDDVGGLPMTIRPVMICDGMVPYPGADLTVRLDVSAEVRFSRVVERDLRWRSRVQERWDHLEMSWRGEAQADGGADIVLDGMVPLVRNARALAILIREALGHGEG